MNSDSMLKKCLKRAIVFLICVLSLLFVLPSFRVIAQNEDKTVKVGWYESPFNFTDKYGKRSGYAYEYQRKIAAYTGWHYEYVEGSWPDLLEKLANGEIDLMSDVSYTPERTEKMFFSELPMGSEEYYLFVDEDNAEISANDYTTLNGKEIGVSADSVQIGMFNEWAAAHGVSSVVMRELDCSIAESIEMMHEGEIDAYLTVDAFADERSVPVFHIDSSVVYFVVNKDKPDLLNELNAAMSKIRGENKNYNEQLIEKYMLTTNAHLGLTETERVWLDGHGPVRVGYQDNYLAFCATDISGNLTGALKDYLELAERYVDYENLKFEVKPYPTADAMLSALKNGEVDCVFPVNLTDSEAESEGLIITSPIVNSEMQAVVRKTDKQSFVVKKDVKVAVNKGNTNYDMFIGDNFPEWTPVYFTDTAACLDGVAAGEADCLIISNYRFNNISKQCDRLGLTTVSTGVHMDYLFAIREGETALYSILIKANILIPDASVSAALNFYSTEDARESFADFVKDNLFVIILLITIVVLVIVLLVSFFLRYRQKVKADEKLISAVERDELTGLYNKNFFFEYAERMRNKFPEKQMDAVVVDIEQFRFINEMHGHGFANGVICALGGEITDFLNENDGIACRFDADRFLFLCAPQSDYSLLLNKFQSRIAEKFTEINVRLRMGVMPWLPALSVERQFDRAHTACTLARSKSGHLTVYDEIIQAKEQLNQRLLNDLEKSLREHEFEVYFQPQYDIRGESPKFVGAEALVRWNHPELGMVSPADFIPLFEKTGQICEMDKYVWRETARQVAAWKEKYNVEVPVSVNLSRISTSDPSLEQTLDGIIEEFALNRQNFKLEITESAYTENADQLKQIIYNLREKGYKIEMDDFGSGYSSLNMISSIPVDVLKMDRGFIFNVEHSEKAMQLVKLILDIAKNLQVPVVAEGVETEKQMIMLKKAGCEIVQGFYFSRPLPAADFERRIIADNI